MPLHHRLRPAHAMLVVVLLCQGISGVVAQSSSSPAELLLAPDILRAFDEEIAGTLMRDHVAHIAGIHRVPASPGYHEAAGR